jgi:hypothetical protein
MRGAIWRNPEAIFSVQCAFLYHNRPAIERLNCMQFSVAIAQFESLAAPRFFRISLMKQPGFAGIAFACTSRHDAHAAKSGVFRHAGSIR